MIHLCQMSEYKFMVPNEAPGNISGQQRFWQHCCDTVSKILSLNLTHSRVLPSLVSQWSENDSPPVRWRSHLIIGNVTPIPTPSAMLPPMCSGSVIQCLFLNLIRSTILSEANPQLLTCGKPSWYILGHYNPRLQIVSPIHVLPPSWFCIYWLISFFFYSLIVSSVIDFGSTLKGLSANKYIKRKRNTISKMKKESRVKASVSLHNLLFVDKVTQETLVTWSWVSEYIFLCFWVRHLFVLQVWPGECICVCLPHRD